MQSVWPHRAPMFSGWFCFACSFSPTRPPQIELAQGPHKPKCGKVSLSCVLSCLCPGADPVGGGGGGRGQGPPLAHLINIGPKAGPLFLAHVDFSCPAPPFKNFASAPAVAVSRQARIQDSEGGGGFVHSEGGGGRTGISGADPSCCRVLGKSTSKKKCRQP